MTIKEMIKKYRISLQENDMLRAYGIETEEERNMLINAKPETIAYLKAEAAKKAQENAEIIEKAKRGEGALSLVIEYDFTYGITIGAARRLTDAEKKKYSEWYAEIAFTGVGKCRHLRHLKIEDMPKKKPDGTFSGGADNVWIITPDEYDKYIQIDAERAEEIRQRKAEEERAEAARLQELKKEKETLIAKVDEWTITKESISDEGGKTNIYKHHFIVHGESLDYVERNMFDVGIIINPDYAVSDGVSGGIALMKNGKLQWHSFISDKGWFPIRPLTEYEEICYTIVAKYGKFAGHAVRR